MKRLVRQTVGVVGLLSFCPSATTFAADQLPAHVAAQVPGGCETPVGQRTSDAGCYLIATEDLGALPSEAQFWHLDEYGSRDEAQAHRGRTSTVVVSFGRTWLFTIASSSFRSPGGKRTASVGPLPTRAGIRYLARYMEAVFPPGVDSRNLVHRHPGPEAWFVLSGTQCLETPDGATVVRAGQSGIVREGPPMSITAVGNEIRRSLVLVLHDASQPWGTMTNDWRPKGLCPQ